MIDLFLIYSFVRRLVTPFTEWDAYKLGIIDERGNVLKKRKDLRRQEERKAFGVFDILVLNLKKLLEKLPAGQTRLASYAAALWLIREWKAFTPDTMLNESVTDEEIIKTTELFFAVITDYIQEENDVNQKMRTLDDFFQEHFMDEDAPTVNVGSGNIAGLGVGPDGEPGLTRSQQIRHRKRTEKGKKLRDILGELN